MAQLPTAQERAQAFITHLPAELAQIRRDYANTCRDAKAGKRSLIANGACGDVEPTVE